MTTLHERHISKLWVKMTQLYGYRWSSSFGERDVDATWLRALQGLTPKMLSAGLEAISNGAGRADGWPPSEPEFKAICQQATLRAHGLPGPEAALEEALYNAHNPTERQWSHNAVYVAGRETGWFELRRVSEDRGKPARDAFKRNYEIVTRKAIAGESFDDAIPLALEDTRGQARELTEQDREAGREAIAALKGIVK